MGFARFCYRIASQTLIVVWCCCCVVSCSDTTGTAESSGVTKKSGHTIGTATQLGVYYTAGLGIADLVNEQSTEVNMTIDATAGSVFNIGGIVEGSLDFGIVQADHQFMAVNGLGLWRNAPQEKLRFVCSLHQEMVSLLASEESGIEKSSDLRYKTINVGPLLSGTRTNAIDVLRSLGIDEHTDVSLEEENLEYAVAMLHNGDIDAYFFTVAHPNDIVFETVSDEDTRVLFVPLEGMNALWEKYPYYSSATIPISLYPQALNEGDVETVGLWATLVTSEGVSDDVVYLVTKTIYDNISRFKAKHPSFATMTRPGMIDNAYAPLHPGALRFYRESGEM